MANSQEDMADSQEDMAYSQQDMADSQYRMANSQEDMADSQYRMANSQYRMANSQGRMANSQYKMANSQGRIADSQGRIADSQGRIADSQGRIADSGEDMAYSQYIMADSQGRIANAQNDIAASNAKSASAQVRLADTARENLAQQKEMTKQAKRSAKAQELASISQYDTSQNLGELVNTQQVSLGLQAERNQLYEKANRAQINKFDEEEKQKQLYNTNINKREQQLKDAAKNITDNTPDRLCFNYLDNDNYVTYLNKLLFFKCEATESDIAMENNILTAFTRNFLDLSNFLKYIKKKVNKMPTITEPEIDEYLNNKHMNEIEKFIISFSSKQSDILSFVEKNFSELQQDKSRANPSFDKLKKLFEKYCVIYDPSKTYNENTFDSESVNVIDGFEAFKDIITNTQNIIDKDEFIYYLNFVESVYNLTYNMYLWFNYLYYLQPLSATASKNKLITDEMLSVYNFVVNELKNYISIAYAGSKMTNNMLQDIDKNKVVNIKLPLFDDIDKHIRDVIVYGNNNNTKGKGSRILFLPPEMFLLDNYFSYKDGDPKHKHKVFIKCTSKKLTYNHYIDDQIIRNVFFELDNAVSNSKYSSFYIKLVVEKDSQLPNMSNMFTYQAKTYPSTFTSSYISDQNMLQNNESGFYMMFNIEKLYYIDEKTQKKISKSSVQEAANKQNRISFIEKLKDEDVVMNFDNLQSDPFYEPEKNIFVNLKYNIKNGDDSVISDIIMLILTNSVFYNSSKRKYNLDMAAIPIFDMVDENKNAYFKNGLYDIYAEQIIKMITNEDEFNKIIPVVKNCIIKNGEINYQQAKQLKQCLKDNKFVNKSAIPFLRSERTDKAFLTISYFIMYVLYHYLRQETSTRKRGGKRKKTPKHRLQKNKSIKLKK